MVRPPQVLLYGLRVDSADKIRRALRGRYEVIHRAALGLTLQELRHRAPLNGLIVGGGLRSCERAAAIEGARTIRGENFPVAEVHLWKVWKGDVKDQVEAGFARFKNKKGGGGGGGGDGAKRSAATPQQPQHASA